MQKELKRGALEFHTQEEAYLAGGKFQPKAMMKLLKESISQAARDGFAGFRSAGDLCWAAEGRGDCDQLIEYEQMVQAVFPGRGATGMCQYDITLFAPDMLDRVFDTHRLALLDTMSTMRHSSLAIRYSDHVVEIVADRTDPKNRFYYVAQRRGSDEILGWGTEPSFDDAMREGDTLIRQMSQRHSSVN